MAKFAWQFRDEPGRRMWTGQIRGQDVTLVAGYDIGEDRYRWHVYIDGVKKTGSYHYSASEDEALDAAEAFADAQI